MVCSSSPLLFLLSVVVLCVPFSLCAPLPIHEPPQQDLALLHLRALLDQPLALDLLHRSPDLDPGLEQNQDQDQEQDLDQEEELTSVEPFGSWNPLDLDSNQASDQDSQQDSESKQDSDQVLGQVLDPDSDQVLGPDSDQVLSRLGREDMQRDLEDRGRLNEALTAVAGGLQAVSREKGGFGFRFGRKRWTPQNPVQDWTKPGMNQV